MKSPWKVAQPAGWVGGLIGFAQGFLEGGANPLTLLFYVGVGFISFNAIGAGAVILWRNLLKLADRHEDKIMFGIEIGNLVVVGIGILAVVIIFLYGSYILTLR